VRGTVRSLSNESKLTPLKNVLGDLFSQIELVEADLLDKESLVNACKGATYVAHTASPLSFGDEDTVVKPAVNGTNYVMEGCRVNGVKRVVVTSSVAAIMAVDAKDKPADGIWREAHWSDENKPGGLGTYVKSKTLAEKAAWKFVEDLPDGEKFELCTICPTMVWGPSGELQESGSNSFLLNYLLGRKAELKQEYHGIVDVRDCAQAQVKCIQVPKAVGHRFICWSGYKS
jgi:nucleoside-diphosphate-sugar epimerase